MQAPANSSCYITCAIAALNSYIHASFSQASSLRLQELFATIVGLSYQGDIRMAFAEDSRKVQRIVEGSFQGLQHMYLPLLQVRLSLHH